jgi:hypothetical protein
MSKPLVIFLATVILFSTIGTVCAPVVNSPKVHPSRLKYLCFTLHKSLSDFEHLVGLVEDSQKDEMDDDKEREQEVAQESREDDTKKEKERDIERKNQDRVHNTDREADPDEPSVISILPQGAYGQLTLRGAKCNATNSEIWGKGPFAVGQVVDGPKSEVTLVETKVWAESGGI